MNNPLLNRDLQSKYQFIVNITRVNKLSSESHRLLWYRSVLTYRGVIDSVRSVLEAIFTPNREFRF